VLVAGERGSATIGSGVRASRRHPLFLFGTRTEAGLLRLCCTDYIAFPVPTNTLPLYTIILLFVYNNDECI
jgi:hypothetical protein